MTGSANRADFQPINGMDYNDSNEDNYLNGSTQFQEQYTDTQMTISII